MVDQNGNPEQKARDSMVHMLEQTNWTVRSNKKADFSSGFGIAVREPQTDVGLVDDAHIIDKKPVSIIEAESPAR
jgi:type I restriction enzyme R subunit